MPALDVPQGYLDRADGGKDNKAAAFGPEGMVVHFVPDRLEIARIFAQHKPLHQILNQSCSGSISHAVRQRRFSQSGNAFIRE